MNLLKEVIRELGLWFICVSFLVGGYLYLILGSGPTEGPFPKGSIVQEKYKTEQYEVLSSYYHVLHGITIDTINTKTGDHHFFNYHSQSTLEQVQK